MSINPRRPSLISLLCETSGSITSGYAVRKKEHSHPRRGDASQLIHYDAFFGQGYFEAGAAAWLWKWILNDWPGCADASSAHGVWCVQGLLWLPGRAVRLRGSGEARGAELGCGGDKRTGWENTNLRNPASSTLQSIVLNADVGLGRQT